MIFFNQCVRTETNCLNREETIALLGADESLPINNLYHLVNKSSFSVEIKSYYTNSFTSSFISLLIEVNDTTKASNTLFANSPGFIVNDSVKLLFNSTPKRCLRYRRAIIDSLTDIRSTKAYIPETNLNAKRNDYISTFLTKLKYNFKKLWSKKKSQFAACVIHENDVNNYFTIDTTHLNQATEEACIE